MVLASLPMLTQSGDTRDDRKMMQGMWLPASAVLAGKNWPDKSLQTMSLTLADGTYTVKVGEGIDKGTVKLDPTKTPKAMDVTGTEGPNKGKTFLAIYELKGDTLRICYDLGGKARPAAFESPEKAPLFLVTYKRSKP
jgi:uncharacterized protein (TIGR03067 family)